MLLSGLEEMPKKTVTALSKKHIYTVDDLLRWFPRKYRDYREVKDIMDCPDGEYCAVAGICSCHAMRIILRRSIRRSITAEAAS